MTPPAAPRQCPLYLVRSLRRSTMPSAQHPVAANSCRSRRLGVTSSTGARCRIARRRWKGGAGRGDVMDGSAQLIAQC